MKETITSYINFIKEAEGLKHTVRSAYCSDGRRESTAEHSWRLALFAGLMAADDEKLNLERVLMMSLIHDLGEIYEGDIAAILLPDEGEKREIEERAVNKLFSMLPQSQRDRFLELWEEYEKNETPEARLVKALDKAETIIQHNQGANPEDFDYKFNLYYGRKYFCGSEELGEIRAIIDADTRKRGKLGPD